MPKILALVLAVILVFTGAAALAGTQSPPGSPARMYNPQTVEVVSGQIEKMERRPMRRGTQEMVGFILKTDKEKLLIILGPSQFIDKMAYKPMVGDLVTVKGSRVVMGKRTMITAAEVRKGDQVMLLRDDTGKPVLGPGLKPGGPGPGPGSGPGTGTGTGN